MTDMDTITKEFFLETLRAMEGRLEHRLGSLEARVELGFSELTDRLDAEQRFTSDMWDDFSLRLAALEAK